MEVVAEEHPERAVDGHARDGRHLGKHLLAIARQRDDGLHRAHDLGHAKQLRRCDKDGLRGKEKRAALPDHDGQTRLTEFLLQRPRESALIQAQAQAVAIQCFDRTGWRLQRGGTHEISMVEEPALLAEGCTSQCVVRRTHAAIFSLSRVRRNRFRASDASA